MSKEEILKLIQSDEETSKAFHVLINLIKRNYPFYKDAETEILNRMVQRGIDDMDGVKHFIETLYFNEVRAGRLFKPVRGIGRA
jgi:hypothetical protein